MKNSKIFILNAQDFFKGVIVAMLAAVITYLAQLISVPGFDFSSIQWVEIGRIALVAGVSYLTKNYFSDQNGKVLGTL